MVGTRKKRQSDKSLLSQLDDFDRSNVIGNTMSDRQESVTVNEGTVNQKFTVNNSGSNSVANENLVKVKTFERCFNEKIDGEMGNIVDTVKDRTQNAILTAFDTFITPKNEFEIRIIHASSERHASSVTANSERGEHMDYCPF